MGHIGTVSSKEAPYFHEVGISSLLGQAIVYSISYFRDEIYILDKIWRTILITGGKAG